MNTWAFVLLLLSTFCFAVEAWWHKTLIALGLAMLSAGLIVQYATLNHTFHLT